MQNLENAYNFATPEKIEKEYTRTQTVHEDGTYSVVFTKDELPSLKEMSYPRKVLYLKDHCHEETGYIIKYDGPDKIFFGKYEKKYRHAGRNIFANKVWNTVIRYDGKRIITNRGMSLTESFLSVILAFFGMEKLLEQNQASTATMIFSNKQVLKGVFTQKITNMHDAVKTWLSSSCKVKIADINYHTLMEYLNVYYAKASDIIDYKLFTTSIEKTMEKVTLWRKTMIQERLTTKYASYADEMNKLPLNKKTIDAQDKMIKEAQAMLSLFEDTLKDAKTLDIKINPEWSQRRMNEEHLKYTHIIMAYQEGEISDEPIYEMNEYESHIDTEINGTPLVGTILNTPRDIFREETLMHHCLFTNYRHNIENKRYIAISLTKPERVTVGIRPRDDMYWGYENNKPDTYACIEQMHTVANGTPSENFKKTMKKYFDLNQEFFDALLHQSEIAKEEQQEIQEQDDAEFMEF